MTTTHTVTITAPVLRDLTRHVDDRGDLAEVFRVSWDLLPDIRQVYLVTDPAAGTIRAFHRHRELWDAFCIVSGSALFWIAEEITPLYSSGAMTGPEHVAITKDWLEGKGPAVVKGAPFHKSERYILSDRKPQVLVVPPGWFHGWMSLEPMTRLLSIASHEYNREAPDEERVPFDSFGVSWAVQPK